MTIEVPYKSERHRRIYEGVHDRFRMAARKVSSRRQEWEEADKLFRGYVKPTTDVAERRNQRLNQGKQTYIDITVPYSYALLLTAHTYWSSVFLARNPILQFTARHGETQQQVQAVEALMDYQVQVGKMLGPLYVWLLDAGKYGVGVVCNYWWEEKAQVTRIEEVEQTFMGIPVPGKTKKQRRVERMTTYLGNKLFNIKPYDFFPDPRVSLVNLQSGEFCGYMTQCSWNELKAKEAQGYYTNLDVLEKKLDAGDFPTERYDPNNDTEYPERPGYETWMFTSKDLRNRGFVELGIMFIDLIPQDWGLGESTYPEKWVFTVANDCVVIQARPLGQYHNQFPFFTLQYEVEGYEHLSRGMPQVLKDLNYTMSWLVNTHFFNVRKALNDQFIVDPTKVNMQDLLDGGPGRIIRLTAAAYGTDVRTAIQQLPVVDVTKGHLDESKVIADLMQMAVGVTENVMGMVNPGGRKTATEIRTSSSFAVNRLKTFAEYNSALGFTPLAQVMLQNTQQEYTLEQSFRIVGDLIQPYMPQFVKVTPELIGGFFDFVPVDGTLPIDRFAQANLWKEVLLGMANIPALAMQYDMAGIFSWMAQLAGLKNISQFRVQARPDAAVAQAMQAGNLVPTGQGMPGGVVQ